MLAKLCLQQLQQCGGEASRLHDWVQTLEPEAAAAVLFAVWHWAQVEAAEQTASSAVPAPASMAAMCLELYPKAKASGDRCLTWA